MGDKNNGQLRSWEYPRKSGIRIREILNTHGDVTFGASYTVTIPAKLTGRLRARKQFKTRTAAEAHATEKFRGYQKQGEDFSHSRTRNGAK